MRFQKVTVRFACWRKHPGPYLCGLVSLRLLNRLVSEIPQGAQAYLGGSAVKEPDQQEQYHSARYPRKPEDPLHSELVEGGANQEKQTKLCPFPGMTTPPPLRLPGVS